jgi:hypothetical protein
MADVRDAAKLAALYDEVACASARGDVRAAHAAFLAIVGLGPRREATAVPTEPPANTVGMLRYGHPKRIDILALLGGARRVAKFDDLPLAAAEAFERRLRAKGLRTVRVGPYAKRFDVAVSGGAGDGLWAVLASWGREAEEVAEAERVRTPEGTRRAGLALGYPPCCVEHFVAVERTPEAEDEGINEAAIRSIGGDHNAIPWEMNPLSWMSPLGFTPCRWDCPEALAFARRVLEAARARDPAAAALIRRALERPILFFRQPIFYVLEGERSPGGVRYAQALPNEPHAGADLAAWQAWELGSALNAGDEVRLAPERLEVRREGAVTARWTVVDPRVPMVLRFG